jgi:hypothetical protein
MIARILGDRRALAVLRRIDRPGAIGLALVLAVLAAVAWLADPFWMAVGIGAQLLVGGLGTVRLLGPAQPGLGFARYAVPTLASVALSVLAGVRDEESGMLSGLNSTGHEVGGSFGIAALTSVVTASTGPAAGIANGFLAAGALAAVGSVIALLVLPPASSFLPKLRLLPSSMPIH